jgi:S-adenosylmethionine hydrolase
MPLTRRPIVLLTDFGGQDPYVGIMKGVIFSRSPETHVIDLGHDLPPQDLTSAALCLRSAVRYFPEGSIFVVVVDPGVGSARRILWAKSRQYQFLAPDNGILSWLPVPMTEMRSVTSTRYFLSPVSTTFQGRDIFAPVSAALSRGLSPARLGPRIKDPVVLPWLEPKRTPSGMEGRIIAFDRFGNALTNLPNTLLSDTEIIHRGRSLGILRSHYGEVPRGRSLAVTGSAGLIEIAVRDGSYQTQRRTRRGEIVHARYRR